MKFITYSATGVCTLDSSQMNGFFPHGGQVCGLDSVELGAGEFSYLAGFSAPLAPFRIQFPQTSSYYPKVTCPGFVSGNSYSPPSRKDVYISHGSTVPYLPSIVGVNDSYVHTAGVPPEPRGYVLFVRGRDMASVSIDSTRRSFQIHPNSSGEIIRSATANSLPSRKPSNYGDTVSAMSQAPSATIVFDQAYWEPPLVFIIRSDGPIAMSYISRDGAGRYVSMEVVAESSIASGGEFGGIGAYNSNSYAFEYFIVSNETSINAPAHNGGVSILDENGDSMFNSELVTTSFDISQISVPLAKVTNSEYSKGGEMVTGMDGIGVCINNFSALSGMGYINTAKVSSQTLGVATVFGRFVSVSGGAAWLYGGYTSSYFTFGPSPWGTTPQAYSCDFHYEPGSSFPVLLARYLY